MGWATEARSSLSARGFFSHSVQHSLVGILDFLDGVAFRIPRPVGDPALNVIFPLFGIPFVLVGLYLAVGRFWLDVRRRAATYYAITSKRILALVSPARHVRSLELRHLDRFTVQEHRDGVGTIAFTPPDIGRLEQIANVRDVEAILFEAHKKERNVGIG